MLFTNEIEYEKDFQRNLTDWCLGGPKNGGWTREGDPIVLNKKYKIIFLEYKQIKIDDILAKNIKEVNKWHISFLKNNKNIESTKYYQEYLLPRYNLKDINFVIKKFISLFENIKNKGFDKKNPIILADVRDLNLGFDYFRFDGCHRAACCKVLGFEKMYSKIFKAVEI